MSGAVFLIPVTVAVVNYMMVVSHLYLLQWKFSTMQDAMATAGVGAGTAVLLGISVACAFLATALVSLAAPICAGSGIPEVLGFLNGNTLPDLFTLRGLCVRIVAIVLVQVAGFPVGREGPMVAIGGTVGFGMAKLLLWPQEKKWGQVVASQDYEAGNIGLDSTTLIVNEERFAHARRVGCALGGAAGIATAFNAPIGGILYMFEELAVSSLPPDLARFMSTVFASLMARALLRMSSMDVHGFVLYRENGLNSQDGWVWADLPLLIVLSAVLGCLGALFSRLLLTSWRLRRKMASRLSAYQPWAKITEATVYCMLCTLVWCLVPALFECKPIGGDGDTADGHHRLLSLDAEQHYVQYACPDGQYNEVASYLLSSAEGCVKHLYAQSGEVQHSAPLAAALLCYFALACGMPGLSVPMGTFVPSMIIGALAGRLFGENLHVLMASLHGPALAPAGVYAIVGSAAVLAGLTHMTVGVVALLAEAAGDFGLIAPLMLSVYVAQTASKLFSSHGYDEHLIIMKGIPFLDPEMPKQLETTGLTAADITEVLPEEALLPPKATVKAIKQALRQRQIKYFPIVMEGSICIGLTTRGRLRAVLEAVSQNHQPGARLQQRRTSVNSTGSAASDLSLASTSDVECPIANGSGLHFARTVSGSEQSEFSQRSAQGHLHDMQTEAKLKTLIRAVFAMSKDNVEYGDCAKDALDLLPLDCIMDSAPHALAEDMPVSRFYGFFNKTGANVAVVVSKWGRFCGILTRTGLIKAQTKLHAGGHGAAASSAVSPGDPSSPVSAGEGHLELAMAKAAAATSCLEEVQVELKDAWANVAEAETVQDDLRCSLRAAEQRIRDLEWQLSADSPRGGAAPRAAQPREPEGGAGTCLGLRAIAARLRGVQFV